MIRVLGGLKCICDPCIVLYKNIQCIINKESSQLSLYMKSFPLGSWNREKYDLGNGSP